MDESSSVLVDRLRQRYALSQEEINKHTQTFDLYDKSSNGSVSLDELTKEVDAQAQLFKDKSLAEGLRKIFIGRLLKFSKGDNCLSYSEFLNCKQYGKIADGFRALKYKGDYTGYVESTELKTYLMTRMKEDLNEQIIDHVLTSVNPDQQGRVTFPDFMEGLIMFLLHSDSDIKRPLQMDISPTRVHLNDKSIHHRLEEMFALSVHEQKELIDRYKELEDKNTGPVSFEQFLELDADPSETSDQKTRRQERVKRLVELSPGKTDSDRFRVNDLLTLKQANKVYHCLNEHDEPNSDYVLEREPLRKYVHRKIWLRGVDGRFLDELLDSMNAGEQISIDEVSIAMAAVIFPFSK